MKHYQEIIDDYNSGKDYITSKEIFDKIFVVYGDLSEEEKRSNREGLTEEELFVFDMLSRDKKITDKEKVDVKKAAKSLLQRLKNKEFKILEWTEKVQTSSTVKSIISNHLFMELPSSTYADSDIAVKTDLLFSEFKTRYGNMALVA